MARRPSPASRSYEPGFVAKSALQQVEKAAIATEAARLVEPGMAIAISAGTTTHALAARVGEIPGVTVVTNSIRVADVLDRSGRARPDGDPDRWRSDAVRGAGRVRSRSRSSASVHLDLVFMGVHGMDGKAGFTCPNLLGGRDRPAR